MESAAHASQATLEAAGIRLTLGGEPTFVPIKPEGAEWSYAAVGPTKLAYAREVAARLLDGPIRGGLAFFTPGKLYPGEANPRWAIRLVWRRDGRPMVAAGRPPPRSQRGNAAAFARILSARLGLSSAWAAFTDPSDPGHTVLAMPLDHDGARWVAPGWKLPAAQRVLLPAEGPAGLRLPLDKLPANVARRAITISWRGRMRSVFFPPLLQKPFEQLLAGVAEAAGVARAGPIAHEGYLPEDRNSSWHMLGITADPGVLEINLPVCDGWEAYRDWIRDVCQACEASGLRSWKGRGFPEGTGGGNHLLWGSPTVADNPFFTRPGWLASVLRLWQAHPSLAYLFSGRYVGPSSQAPRPDESGHALHDLEMTCHFLESLPKGDHRSLINEALRHLHTDASGNTHRSEISFDKFWNPDWPGGSAGLIEFRAVESLPNADGMAAVALLWQCLAAYAVEHPPHKRLRNHDSALHDRFLLPRVLWHDLSAILRSLHDAGYRLPEQPFREIWEWRFPLLLDWKSQHGRLTLRRALEVWPLLSEMPLEGGTTSRFVDASLHRIEVAADRGFANRYELHVCGRPLRALRTLDEGWQVAGVRYRQTRLRPSLHPGIAPHVPLDLCILDRRTHRVVAAFQLLSDEAPAKPVSRKSGHRLSGEALRPLHPGEWTMDLRVFSVAGRR